MVKIAQAESSLLKTMKVFNLPSGLKLIFQKNDSAKVVAIQIWVKTGSAYEDEREAGISHFIEHMVFKGTKHYQPGEIAKIIEGHGGSINAYTSFDYTVYHVVMPSEKWQIGLNILIDMVKNATFEENELEQERKVILEEIRKDHDSPFFILSNTLFSTAYKIHPYRRPVIGWTETVNAIKRENLLNYYHYWYKPSNMVIVVVGNVEEKKVKEVLNKAFPEIHPPVHFQPKTEPPQSKMRLKILKKPFKETYLGLAFPIPKCGTPEAHALDILSEILGGGESSRLTVALKLKKPIVHSISTHSFTPKGPGLFIIYAVLDEKNVKKALKEIFYQIEKIKHEGVLNEELAKAKLNVEADFIFDQETMEGWARTLGVFEVVEGDARKCEEYLFDIKNVTVEEIKEVTRKFLIPEHLSLVLVLPEEAKLNLKKEEIYKLWPKYIEKEKISQKKVHKFVLKNGLTLLIKENHRLPTFAISAVFMGGLRAETKKTNGICNFVAKMLMRGTKIHSAVELANLIESMAGEIDTFSGWNTFGLNAHFLSRYFKEAMSIIKEILCEPSFDPEEIEKLRPLLLAAIKQKEDRPPSLAFHYFYQTLYQNHPYGMDVLGTKETISKINRDDLINFYQKYVIPNNLVLAVVGDVHTEKVLATVEKLFGDWPKKEINLFKPPTPLPPSQDVIVKKYLPKEQVHFVLGNLSTTLYSQDRYAMAVLDALLSGQGGRLFINLRDKKGLAYALSFVHREGIEPGIWGIYMATSPDTLKKAIDGVKNELEKLIKDGIKKEEVENAKEYVLGQFLIGLQTNSQQAISMALNERYGLGYNYDELYIENIKKVTKEDIIKVIKKYLAKKGYVLSLIGPIKDF